MKVDDFYKNLSPEGWADLLYKMYKYPGADRAFIRPLGYFLLYQGLLKLSEDEPFTEEKKKEQEEKIILYHKIILPLWRKKISFLDFLSLESRWHQ